MHSTTLRRAASNADHLRLAPSAFPRDADQRASLGRFFLNASSFPLPDRIEYLRAGDRQFYSFRRTFAGMDSPVLSVLAESPEGGRDVWSAGMASLDALAADSAFDIVKVFVAGSATDGQPPQNYLRESLYQGYDAVFVPVLKPEVIELADSYDVFLGSLGRHTRRDMRHLQRKAEASGLTFDFGPAVLAGCDERRSLGWHAAPKRYPRWEVDSYDTFIAAQPQSFAASLRQPAGQLVSYCTGLVSDGAAMLRYQLNHAAFPKASLSLTNRSFLIERLIEEGIREFISPGGAVGLLARACRFRRGGELILIRRSATARAKAMAISALRPSTSVGQAARLVVSNALPRRQPDSRRAPVGPSQPTGDIRPVGPSAYSLWPLLRNAVTASFWPIFDQAMVSGSNFLTNVVVARELGAYNFGIFTLAWSAVLFGLSLQLSLISMPMYTLAGKVREDKAAEYYGALLIFEAAFTAIVFAIAYVGSWAGGIAFEEWPYDSYPLAVAVVAVSYLWQDFVRRCLFSRGRTAAAFAIDVIAYPAQIAVLILLANHGMTLEKALWIIGGTSIVSAVVGLPPIFPLRVTWSEVWRAAIEHWAFARWIVGSIATNWVVLNFFYVIAGIVLGATSVAGLRASALLFAAGNVFFLGLENFVPVRGARLLAGEGMPALVKYMRFWLTIGISVSLGLSVCVAGPASFWLRLAFGDAFSGSVGIVYILSLMYPLSCYVSLGGVLLRCASATRQIFFIWAAMAVVGLVVAYPLIQSLGVYGAAGGQLGCYAVGCWLTYRSIRRLTHRSSSAASAASAPPPA